MMSALIEDIIIKTNSDDKRQMVVVKKGESEKAVDYQENHVWCENKFP